MDTTYLANTKNWLTVQKIKYQAARRIKRDGVQGAARAMYTLNRHVAALPDTKERRWIYTIKTIFIRWLYQHGYCLEVVPEQQTLPCHTCAGSGKWYNGDECYRCGGTGIYQQHILYQFTFDVNGQRYVWHQPKSIVNWEVKLDTWDSTRYEPSGERARLGDGQTSAFYLLMVGVFLVRNGVDKSKLFGFSSLIKEMLLDWKMVKHEIDCRLLAPAHRYWQRLLRAWKYFRTGDVRHISENEEIPF